MHGISTNIEDFGNNFSILWEEVVIDGEIDNDNESTGTRMLFTARDFRSAK